MENSVEPIIYVNGKRYVLPPHRAEVALLSYLRGEITARSQLIPLRAPRPLLKTLSAAVCHLQSWGTPAPSWAAARAGAAPAP